MRVFNRLSLGLNGSISNEFRLAGLWVRASMRRSGAGNALILSVVDWAKKQISGAEIHLWSTDGILASYYEKLGFKLTTNTKPFGVQNERTLVEMVWRT